MGYSPLEADRSINNYAINHHDFHLGLPSIIVDPASLEETMALDDEAKTQTIYLENQGSVPGTFRLYEHDKGYQPVAPRDLNIPEFTGTLPDSDAPLTNQPKPLTQKKASDTDQGVMIELNSEASKYGINEVVPAYAMHMMTDPATLYKFPNAGNPSNWQPIGPATRYAFAADFLGADYSKGNHPLK